MAKMRGAAEAAVDRLHRQAQRAAGPHDDLWQDAEDDAGTLSAFIYHAAAAAAQPQPAMDEDVEAALETMRDVIALFTRHEGRSEQEFVHRSHMDAWYTLRRALAGRPAQPTPEQVLVARRAIARRLIFDSDIPAFHAILPPPPASGEAKEEDHA